MFKTMFSKLSLLTIALLMAGTALAQDAGATGQAASPALPTVKIVGISAEPGLDASVAANAASATFGSLSLTVQIDNSYCATGGVQCTGPGLSTVAPAHTNRNPVRLGLQVLDGGAPVTNLTDAEINVLNSFVPAGGTAINQLACPTCFQNAGNGMYAIFLHPVNNAFWKSGSYFVQVQVKVGTRTHRALAQIEIPF